MPLKLRAWQEEALARWEAAGHRGIVGVVTGGGKTVFALSCVARLRPPTTLVVVPTAALLDQWWEEAASYFAVGLDEIQILSSKARMRAGTINIAVLNTAAALTEAGRILPSFLIIDECHKAGADKFRTVLNAPKIAALGLSATPERPYDDALAQVIVPALGNVIFTYGYPEALRDGVIVPFLLHNVVFELEEDRRLDYERLTKIIARSIQQNGIEAQETVAALLRRARVLNLSPSRIRLAISLVAQNRGKRTLIFHEDIEACNVIGEVLIQNGVRAGIYHSALPVKERARMLFGYRRGDLDVLVTCKALDEGFNVPETEVGIIAASTATRRQRIQRLGRVLRPAGGKASAEIYTLVATAPEITRLREEQSELEGVADVTWSQG